MQQRPDGGRSRFKELISYGVSALIGAIVVIALGRVTIGAVIAIACLVYLAVVWFTRRPGDGRG